MTSVAINTRCKLNRNAVFFGMNTHKRRLQRSTSVGTLSIHTWDHFREMHVVSRFQFFLNSRSPKGPLHIACYAMRIRVSVMEL